MNAIFAALVNGAILSTLAALTVWVGLRLAPHRALNAATRYGIWSATLAAAVVLPFLYLPPDFFHTLRTERSAEAGPGPAVAGLGVRPAHGLDGLPQGLGLRSRGPLSRSLPWFPLKIAAGSWPGWVLKGWTLAAALMLMRLLVSYLLLKRRTMRAADAPPHLAGRVGDWMARCGYSRLSVRLAVSSEIAAPMVSGLDRPSILIPERLLEELDECEIEQVGLHEMAHLARGDDYGLILQRLAEAVLVLHPVVHWIGRRLDLEREIACDDFVLNATGQARPYAACLLKVVELTGGVGGSLTAAAIAGRRSHLSKRVDMLLDGARHTGTRLSKVRLGAAAASIAALAGVAAEAPGLLAFAAPAVQQARRVAVPAAPAPQDSSAQMPRPAPRPIASPEAPPVKMAVTVQDQGNRYVTGLAPENFRVTEDGVPLKIAAMSYQDVPMSIGILFDASGSTRARLPEAQNAVAEFLGAARPASQSFLVTYNQAALLAESFTSDASRITHRIDMAEPRGGTSLREAILLALQQMQNAPNPTKELLIVSDGGPDNSSGVSTNDVEQAVSAAKVQVYAISFPTSPVTHDTSHGLGYLDRIAELSSGQHFVVDSGSPLPEAARGIALRNQYVLEYRSTNAVADGLYRRLRVEVTPPDGSSQFKVTYRVASGSVR